MTIVTLKPNKANCRPFYVVHQLETGAWGHGRTQRSARRRMEKLKRRGRLIYKPELEQEKERAGDRRFYHY